MNQQIKTFLIKGSLSVLTAVAVIFAVSKLRHFRADGEAETKVWFYDQSSSRLYPAPRDLVPPDGSDDTRVRAVVVGFQGLGSEASQLKIAYLEKYSADFKGLLERAAAAHAARRLFTGQIPSQGSAYYLNNTMVKRPGENVWHGVGTEEARQIMDEWRDWRGPTGQPPMISVPSAP